MPRMRVAVGLGAFAGALAAWSLIAPAYSALLRAVVTAVLPLFERLLDAASGSPAPDLATMVAALPIAEVHVNVVVVAALAAATPGVAGVGPRSVLAVCAALVLSHVVAILFTLDWAYVTAAAARPPAVGTARIALSALGFWVFRRVGVVAVPLLVWAVLLARVRAGRAHAAGVPIPENVAGAAAGGQRAHQP